MKRAVIVLIIAAVILVITGIWFATVTKRPTILSFAEIGVIVLVIGFALLFGYKKLSSAIKGEPAEDELSRKVVQKTAALSYYISLYLWLAVMFFSDKAKIESHTLIGTGIMGMAVVFAACWLVIRFRGIGNE